MIHNIGTEENRREYVLQTSFQSCIFVLDRTNSHKICNKSNDGKKWQGKEKQFRCRVQ